MNVEKLRNPDKNRNKMMSLELIKTHNRKSAKSFINRNGNKWNMLDKDLVRVWDHKQFCNSLLSIY